MRAIWVLHRGQFGASILGFGVSVSSLLMRSPVSQPPTPWAEHRCSRAPAPTPAVSARSGPSRSTQSGGSCRARLRFAWEPSNQSSVIGQKGKQMTVEDEFRKHAERCRHMAEASTKTADRAFWLLLAENWQRLAQHTEEKPPEERGQTDVMDAGAR
jgi:hypothetical protein